MLRSIGFIRLMLEIRREEKVFQRDALSYGIGWQCIIVGLHCKP